MYQKKLSEISKIKDKNKRIVKILQDLDLTEEVVKPELSIYEDPESLLTVEDHEVGNGRLGWWEGNRRRKGLWVLACCLLLGAWDVEPGGKEGGALDYVSFGSTGTCLPKN